jgi:hypothetical protein
MQYLRKKEDLTPSVYATIWLSVIITWLPFPFLLIFDFFIVEPFHQITFRLNGMELVNRKKHIKVWDRARLQYLNWYQKLGCAYCGYVNGWASYAKEIFSRSEKHWCGIMHEKDPNFKIPKHHIEQDFSEFGDEKEFKEKYLK